jgi:hypothetical protein
MTDDVRTAAQRMYAAFNASDHAAAAERPCSAMMALPLTSAP